MQRPLQKWQYLAKKDKTSAIADQVKTTGHNIKWDHFDILAKSKSDYHCKIKDLIHSRPWTSFQRQRWKWKADALLTYSSFYSLLSSICLI